MTDATSSRTELELIHPVYLDVPMMVSFFAALEGGVSYTGEFTERIKASAAREREAEGKARLPAIASLFGLGFDMSGRLKRLSQDEESTEMKVIREHTEASLFNLLRESLRSRDDFIEVVDTSQLEQVNAGQLVEISGEILGNPLQQILDAIWQILPYMGIDPDADGTLASSSNRSQRRGQQQRSGQRRQSAQAPGVQELDQPEGFSIPELKLLRTMRGDVNNALVRDLILRSSGDVRAVLTMAREFLTPQTEEYLLGGRFVATGKITRVLEEGESINLTRRTALGLASPDIARQLISGFNDESGDMSLGVEDPIIEAPALQILPLAVFV